MENLQQNNEEILPEGNYPARIMVKFREVAAPPHVMAYRLGNQNPDHLDPNLSDVLREWLAQQAGHLQAWLTKEKEVWPHAPIQRAFPSVSPGILEEMNQQAVSLDPTYEPVDFQSFYMIEVPHWLDPDFILKLLHSWSFIEYAYLMSPPAPPPSWPTGANPQLADRDYLKPPDFVRDGVKRFGGIDVEYVWQHYGDGMSAGNGVTFVDVEKGWNLGHQDFAGRNIPLNGCNKEEKRHGTNVLGILFAQDNNTGGVGIAYKADARVVSGWVNQDQLLWHDAILLAGSKLKLGDVLLVEAQCLLNQAELPVEIEPAIFVAIRLLTALGIIVVEAAGNGGRLLDVQTDQRGKRIFDPTSRDYKDSGAILVGAAEPFETPAPRRGESNYGARVDCFGAGTLVCTTDTDVSGTSYALQDRQDFSGTSAASAIVAGAALVLQGIALQPVPAGLGFRLNAFQMRNILGDTTPGINTPSKAPGIDKIGVMPNLQNILRNLNGVYNRDPDLVVRDSIEDDGRAHNGLVSCSPDIIIRGETDQSVLPNQFQSALGGLNPNRDNEDLSTPVNGQSQLVFTRVMNRGGSVAKKAMATVYWSPAATLVHPDMWHLIGTSDPLAAPVGLSPTWVTVLNPIRWPNNSAGFPGSGNYCYVAVVSCLEDPNPIPDPAQLTQYTFDEYLELIQSNNNIAWRNMNTVPMSFFPGAPLILVFSAPGAFDLPRTMQLQVVADLPPGSTLFLEGNTNFVVSMANGQVIDPSKPKRLALNPCGTNVLKPTLFPARSTNDMQLGVFVPGDQRNQTYNIRVKHFYNNLEVGRLTWKLVPKR